MKYILLMNGNKLAWEACAKCSKQDLDANVAFMCNLGKQLKEERVFVAAEGLGWPREAKIVRADKEGEPITDGDGGADAWPVVRPGPVPIGRLALQPAEPRDRPAGRSGYRG